MNTEKENTILYDSGQLPRTPKHLLKRTRSQLSAGKSALATKRAPVRPGTREARPPLASKDSNQAPAGLRRIQKYGSVLGIEDVPSSKNLVLKIDDKVGDEETDETSEDEFTLNLREPTVSRIHNLNGHKSTLKLASKAIPDDIEYGPQRSEPLPYIPEGYEPLQPNDFKALKSYQSPFKVFSDDEASESEDDANTLLPLEPVPLAEDAAEPVIEDKTTATLPAEVIRDIDARYYGKGLTEQEIQDLLDD